MFIGDDTNRHVTAIHYSVSNDSLILRCSDGTSIKVSAIADKAADRRRLNTIIRAAAEKTEFKGTEVI